MFLYFAVHTCFHEEIFGFAYPFGTRICKPVSLHPVCFEFLYRARGDLFQEVGMYLDLLYQLPVNVIVLC